MKKLALIIFLFAAFAVNIKAQTFTFTRTSLPYVNGDTLNYEIVSYGDVHNLTNDTFQIRLVRFNVNVPSGWTSAVCDIVACYPPEIDTCIANYPPGNNEISAHFYMDTIPGEGTMQIRAEKVSNPSESHTATFGARTNPIGITQISTIVEEFNLGQNYPNPFNPATKINFSIPKNDFVSLRVYDILGREVRVLISQSLTIGEYEVDFDAKGLASGMYYYSLRAGEYVSVKKMVLVK